MDFHISPGRIDVAIIIFIVAVYPSPSSLKLSYVLSLRRSFIVDVGGERNIIERISRELSSPLPFSRDSKDTLINLVGVYIYYVSLQLVAISRSDLSKPLSL